MPAEATGAIRGQDTEVSFLGVNSPRSQLAARCQTRGLQLLHLGKYLAVPDTGTDLAFATDHAEYCIYAEAFSSSSKS